MVFKTQSKFVACVFFAFLLSCSSFEDNDKKASPKPSYSFRDGTLWLYCAHTHENRFLAQIWQREDEETYDFWIGNFFNDIDEEKTVLDMNCDVERTESERVIACQNAEDSITVKFYVRYEELLDENVIAYSIRMNDKPLVSDDGLNPAGCGDPLGNDLIPDES